MALPVVLATFVLLATSVAQFSNPQPIGDRSFLRPPAGARVAIVEFDDMECPVCAQVNPLLKQASQNYHIPWVRHDFPLPQHRWSRQAAVNARWFDTKSKKTGDDYRDAVFADQINIENLDGLRDFTQRFAQTHSLALPFAVDPQGKLEELVKSDSALGSGIGIDRTPTVYIVTNSPTDGAPFAQVKDFSQLYTNIDRAFAATKPAASPHPVKH